MGRLFQKPSTPSLCLNSFYCILCNLFSIQSMQNWEYCRQWSYFETWHGHFQDKASIYHFIYNPCFICCKSSTIIWSIYGLIKFKNSAVTGIYGKKKDIKYRSVYFRFLVFKVETCLQNGLIMQSTNWKDCQINYMSRSQCFRYFFKIYCKKRFKQFSNMYNIRMVDKIYS